ncbi:VOC family protein [Micromonospora zhanjiangensis]
MLDAPGLPPRSVKVIDPRVPVAKWPDPGQELPIKVAIDDPRHVRILWDEVPTHAERAAMADLPPEFDDYDALGDDFLIEQEAPPWARRQDPDYPPPAPADPTTADLSEDLGRLRDDPVVMHHGPGGTIVLEGTVVEPSAAPLPRRPSPRPYPRRDRTAAAAAPVAADQPVRAAEPVEEHLPPRPTADPTGDFDDPTYPAEDDRPVDPDRGAGFDELTDLDGGTSGGTAAHGRAATRPEDAADPLGATASAGVDEPTGPRSAGIDDLADGSPVRPAPAAGVDDLADAGPVRPAPAARATVPKPSPPLDDIDIDLDFEEPGSVRPAPTSAGATPAGTATSAGAAATAGAGDPAAGAGPISGVGITLLVTNLDTSIAFYRDMLGFRELDAGEGNAVLASGATRLVLRAVPEVAPINRRLVHLNLEVADVQAAHAELRDKGVRFTYAPRVVNRGERLELWAAAFRDPDGHGIALTQWRERTTT